MAHTIYPCTKSGKILRGFCPTICNSYQEVTDTLFGYIRFASKFGIKYYFWNNQVFPLPLKK